MATFKTILLFSALQVVGCSDLGDKGGISSGGDQPAPAPQPAAAQQDSGSGPAASTTDSSTTAATASGTPSTTSTAAAPANSAAGSLFGSTGSSSPNGLAVQASVEGGTNAVAIVSSTTGGTTMTTLTLSCQAQFVAGQSCLINSSGVSINGAAAQPLQFTTALPTLSSVMQATLATQDSQAETAAASGTTSSTTPSAPYCAVQALGQTYILANSLNDATTSWQLNLDNFLQKNCTPSN